MLSVLTKIDIKIPNTPIIANEYRKLVASAIKPMMGGPNKNPKKLMLETTVSAIPVGTFGLFPAIVTIVGITFETPKPTSIKAIVHGIK